MQMLSRRLRIEIYETNSIELIRDIVSKSNEENIKTATDLEDLNEMEDIQFDENDDHEELIKCEIGEIYKEEIHEEDDNVDDGDADAYDNNDDTDDKDCIMSTS